MSIWDLGKKFIKGRGISVSKKIPIGPKPLRIDQTIRKEMQRAKIKSTLEKVRVMVNNMLTQGEPLSFEALLRLRDEIRMRLSELEETK